MTIGKADLSKADIGVIAALLVGVLSAASLASFRGFCLCPGCVCRSCTHCLFVSFLS